MSLSKIIFYSINSYYNMRKLSYSNMLASNTDSSSIVCIRLTRWLSNDFDKQNCKYEIDKYDTGQLKQNTVYSNRNLVDVINVLSIDFVN